MSLRKALYWSLGGDWIIFFTTMMGTVIVARLLTPAQMGVFTFAMAIMAVLQGVFGQGINRFVFVCDRIEDDPSKFGSVILLSIVQGLLIGIPLAIAAPFVGNARHVVELRDVMLILAIIPPFAILDSVWISLLNRDLRFPAMMTNNIIRSIAATIITIAAAWNGFGPLSQALGMTASTFVSLGTTTWLVRRQIRWSPSLKDAREVLKFLGDSAVLGAVYSVNMRMPDLVLGSTLRLSDLGQWGRANTSVNLLRQQVIEPMMRVQLPAMARDRDAGLGMGAQIERFNMIFAGMLWPLLTILAVLAKPTIWILLGSQWTEAAQLLPIFCLYNLITMAAAGAGETYLLTNNLRRNIWFEVIRGIVLIAILLVASQYGLYATACAMLIEACISFALKFQILRRWGGASGWQLLTGFRQGLLLSAAFAAPAFGVMAWYQWPPMLPFWMLALVGIAGGACWFLIALLIKHPAAAEIRFILNGFLEKVWKPQTKLG